MMSKFTLFGTNDTRVTIFYSISELFHKLVKLLTENELLKL